MPRMNLGWFPLVYTAPRGYTARCTAITLKPLPSPPPPPQFPRRAWQLFDLSPFGTATFEGDIQGPLFKPNSRWFPVPPSCYRDPGLMGPVRGFGVLSANRSHAMVSMSICTESNVATPIRRSSLSRRDDSQTFLPRSQQGPHGELHHWTHGRHTTDGDHILATRSVPGGRGGGTNHKPQTPRLQPAA